MILIGALGVLFCIGIVFAFRDDPEPDKALELTEYEKKRRIGNVHSNIKECEDQTDERPESV